MSYLGFDVLTAPHDASAQIAESFGRSGELVGAAAGKRWFDDQGGVPLPTRSFLWTCKSRAEIADFRAFRAARKGRLVPFWVSTCCWDLRVAADAIVGALSITVRASSYPQSFFPSSSRRYLSICDRGQGPALCKVTDATNMDALTDSITIDTPLPFALHAGTAFASFLVLCRLADDAVETNWRSTTWCTNEVRFVELPKEVPA